MKELVMTIEMDPYYFLAYMHIGQVYTVKSMFNESIDAFEKAVRFSGNAPMTVANLAIAYYLIENREKAENLIKSLKQRSKQEYVPASCFLYYALIQGDNDQAYKWLESAVIEHDSFLPWIITFPVKRFQLPDEPRFNKMMKKIGLKRREYIDS
jgi:tetratricopeptide (TPR) repeat protein